MKELPSLPDNTDVFVETDGQHTSGTVVEPANAPRSHIVETQSGLVRRNRSHLRVVPETQPSDPSTNTTIPTRDPIRTRSRTGTPIVPPDRLT